jgi:TRAP transporter TAXI family solute receptor
MTNPLTKLIALLSTTLLAVSVPASDHYLIGTGSKGATFYPVAKALCHVIESESLDFTCEAVATPGSTYNLEALENREIDLALSQGNLQYLATQGLAPFSGEHRLIRTVAPMHKEIFILAVLPGSNIEGLADLKGKRVNIGNVGSGSRLITLSLFEFLGWGLGDIEAHNQPSADLPDLLCNKKIDAAIYSTGHPNAIYTKLLDQCQVTLVNLWNEDIGRFVEANWEFSRAMIPGDTYSAISDDRYGFGIQVLLSARHDLPAEHIAQIVQILVEQNSQLAKMASVYKTIDASGSVGLKAAPLHEGTVSYFKKHPQLKPQRSSHIPE